jgi:hypothetical protein
MTRICLLALLSFASPVSAQTLDSSFVALVASLRAELHGGGVRDTMVWVPRDSVSAHWLRLTASGTHDALLPVGDDRPQCPGNTDASGARFPQPVGYHFRVRILTHGADSATVQLEVGCSFSYLGRHPRGFLEFRIWDAAKAGDRWAARLVRMGVT